MTVEAQTFLLKDSAGKMTVDSDRHPVLEFYDWMETLHGQLKPEQSPQSDTSYACRPWTPGSVAKADATEVSGVRSARFRRRMNPCAAA
jgi:hypothetical protein